MSWHTQKHYNNDNKLNWKPINQLQNFTVSMSVCHSMQWMLYWFIVNWTTNSTKLRTTTDIIYGNALDSLYWEWGKPFLGSSSNSGSVLFEGLRMHSSVMRRIRKPRGKKIHSHIIIRSAYLTYYCLLIKLPKTSISSIFFKFSENLTLIIWSYNYN